MITRYRVIPANLRERLDKFFELVVEISAMWADLTSLGKRIEVEQTGSETQKTISVLDWVVRVSRPGVPIYEQAFSPSTALARRERIMDYVKRIYPGADSYFFFVQAEYSGGPGRSNLAIDQGQVEAIFGRMEAAFAANRIAQDQAEKIEQLLSKGKELRELVGIIVEQPWKS